MQKATKHPPSDPAPLVSVVMSVYNAGEYLREAVESILKQTYKNFEFIIVDDGSTDNSFSTLKSFSDNRLEVFKQRNQGIQKALNFGISQARGKYIARMDQDDISAPRRLERQVRSLERNSRIAFLGTSFTMIDMDGKLIGHSYHMDRPEDIKLEIFTRNPLGHGTTMIRRSALLDVGGYNEKQDVEDYDLWYRLLKDHDGMSLAEELYSWRVVPTSMSHGGADKRQALIHDYVIKIWEETQLPSISVGYLKNGLDHYSKLGEGYEEQYRFMLATLCVGAFKMGRRLYAIKLFLKLQLANANIMGPIRTLRHDPLSHNYLLMLIHPD
jgi:glycosyltransferase involved in cell wall biosynthesis